MDDTWENTHFGDLTQGPDGDFDGDGLSNLLERAFGTSPSDSGDRVPMPEGTIVNDAGDDYLAITYRRLTGGSGTTGNGYTVGVLSYTVEYDADLTDPWSIGAVVAVGSPVNNADGTETVTVRLSTPISAADKQFIRLRVTPAP